MPTVAVPRAPIPVQTPYAVPTGIVFIAFVSNQKDKIETTTNPNVGQGLEKPSDNFKSVAKRISAKPAANKNIHPILILKISQF